MEILECEVCQGIVTKDGCECVAPKDFMYGVTYIVSPANEEEE